MAPHCLSFVLVCGTWDACLDLKQDSMLLGRCSESATLNEEILQLRAGSQSIPGAANCLQPRSSSAPSAPAYPAHPGRPLSPPRQGCSPRQVVEPQLAASAHQDSSSSQLWASQGHVFLQTWVGGGDEEAVQLPSCDSDGSSANLRLRRSRCYAWCAPRGGIRLPRGPMGEGLDVLLRNQHSGPH